MLPVIENPFIKVHLIWASIAFSLILSAIYILTQLEQQADTEREVSKSAISEIRDLSEELKTALDQNSQLKNGLNGIKTLNTDLQDEVSALASELSRLKNQQSEMQAQLSQRNSELTKQQSEINRLTNLLENAVTSRESVAEYAASRKTLAVLFQQTPDDQTSLTERLTEEQTVLTELEQQLDGLNQNRNQTQSVYRVKDGSIRIILAGKWLFSDIESRSLTSQGKTIVSTLASAVKKLDKHHIVITGHINMPAEPEAREDNSGLWTTTATLAAIFADELSRNGVDPQRMAAVGLADTRVLTPESIVYSDYQFHLEVQLTLNNR